MGDGRAEGSSAIGDGGQAATSLTPDTDEVRVQVSESSQLEGSCVGDLLFCDALDASYVLKIKSVNGCPGLCLTQDTSSDIGRRWHLRDNHNAGIKSYGTEYS